MPLLVPFILYIVTVLVALMMALRVVFWLVFDDLQSSFTENAFGYAFYLGFKFDLRCALLIAAPLAVLGWIRFCNPIENHNARVAWLTYFSISGFLLLLIYGIDFGHYAYLASRLDASALRFLQNPYESFGVIWSAYPVLTGTGLLLAATFAIFWILRFLLTNVSNTWHNGLKDKQKVAFITLFIAAYLGGIYGKFSYYPLRWSDAFFSPNNFVSSLALNPALYFLDTFKNRDLQYDVTNVQESYDLMTGYLGVDQPSVKELSFERKTTHSSKPLEGKPSIVIMMLESNASHKTGIFGNPLNPSPNFDELARNGKYFTRFYAPHIGTARAVFASFFGLPDLEVNQTSSRNPLTVVQHTLFKAFDDYEKYYFLGGSASWANIRAMLKHNIPQLHIYEEGSYSADRVDVWGISDLHMLEEANTVFANLNGKPFVAFIHLSGNHPPYNIPKDNRGFEYKNISDDEASQYGFESAKAYNSYRFMDHSLGFYFERAKSELYFKNTVFVLYGDNGTPNSSEHQAAGERELELTRYQTPLVIYSSDLIKPAVIDTIGSTLDVLPTIVGLLSLNGVNTTIGRDLFDTRFDDSRYALTITRQGPGHLLGLVGKNYYFLIGSNGSNPRLHRIYTDNPSKNLMEELPEIAYQYQTQLFAIYDTAKYMRYHNQ